MPTPAFPKYGTNALRPNPHTADASKGELAFVQGAVLSGDFGDEGAAVRPSLGLPPTSPPPKKGQPDETRHGWT